MMTIVRRPNRVPVGLIPRPRRRRRFPEPALPVLAPNQAVHIVSGSFGAGHDAAAEELAERFEAAGHRVSRWDVVDLLPARIGPVLRRSWTMQMQHAPSTWGAVLAQFEPGRVGHRVGGALFQAARSGFAPLLDAGPDLVISTHPIASQVLGRLRKSGRLAAPVLTWLCDMSVHPMWVHPGVDLHLAIHQVAAGQAKRLGARTRVVAPVLPPPVLATPAMRAEVRHRLGITSKLPMALVVGGADGYGDLVGTAADLAGLAHPVVVCARNEGLHARLRDRSDLTALGWCTDLPDLIAASDLVVQNAGGFTSLQGLASGVPIITYRSVPGHGEANNAALAEAGWVQWIKSREALAQLVAELSDGPPAASTPPWSGQLDVMDGLGLSRLSQTA